MKEAFHTVIFIAIQYIVAFLVCLIAGFMYQPESVVLEYVYTVYKLNTGLLYFISLLPALQMSGILVGFSWAFGRNYTVSPMRWSKIFLVYIKGAILVILGCLIITIIGSELGAPLLKQQRRHMENNSAEYREYIALSYKHIDKKDYQTALFYNNQAKSLFPDSVEIMALDEQIEIAAAEQEAQPTVQTEYNKQRIIIPSDTAMNAEQMLDTAVQYFNAKDYFNAHYFASLAADTISERNPNSKKAKKLASEAWNRLNDDTAVPTDKEALSLYTAKKSGYTAIQQKRYLVAYYIFNRLAKDNKPDPDIKRFLQIAADNLKKICFFTDETEDMQAFESANDIYFSVFFPDGSRDIVFIKGITLAEETGTSVKYLRNFNSARFSSQNQLLWHYQVPYAKMIAIPSADLEGNISKTETVPLIMLQSVDREEEGVMISPDYEYTEAGLKAAGQTQNESNSIIILPMPFEDFSLVSEASHGTENMSLFSLFQFSRKAELYGYSAEVYVQSFIERLCFPFLLLILSVLATILGWNYRIPPGHTFKILWLLLVPLFTAISWFVIKIAEYIFSLFICLFVGSNSRLALPVTMLLLITAFILSSILFVSQRGE